MLTLEELRKICADDPTGNRSGRVTTMAFDWLERQPFHFNKYICRHCRTFFTIERLHLLARERDPKWDGLDPILQCPVCHSMAGNEVRGRWYDDRAGRRPRVVVLRIINRMRKWVLG